MCLCVQVCTNGTSAVYECVVDCVHVCLMVASVAVCPCRCLCECKLNEALSSSPPQKVVQEGSSKLEAPLPKVHADRVRTIGRTMLLCALAIKSISCSSSVP